METLASILAGQGANPYQMAGSGISPLIAQALLAQQMGQQQLGAGQAQSQDQVNPAMQNMANTNGAPAMPQPMAQQNPLASLAPSQLGSLGAAALPGIASGAY
jgi:hypothetical protein